METYIIQKNKTFHFSKSNLFYTFAEKQKAKNVYRKGLGTILEVERDVVVAELESEDYEKMKEGIFVFDF